MILKLFLFDAANIGVRNDTKPFLGSLLCFFYDFL